MKPIFTKICKDFEAELVEFDGEGDKEKLWGNALWSPNYFAGSCGGVPLEIIKQYIKQQETPS